MCKVRTGVRAPSQAGRIHLLVERRLDRSSVTPRKGLWQEVWGGRVSFPGSTRVGTLHPRGPAPTSSEQRSADPGAGWGAVPPWEPTPVRTCDPGAPGSCPPPRRGGAGFCQGGHHRQGLRKSLRSDKCFGSPDGNWHFCLNSPRPTPTGQSEDGLGLVGKE